jgi:oligosaccharyltransferase complex subunit epsilon
MQKSASASSTTKRSSQSKLPQTAVSWQDLLQAYQKQTSVSCKALDGFLGFCVLTGVAQAAYCVLVSSFPFNAFIGVFAASIGSFVFAGKSGELS